MPSLPLTAAAAIDGGALPVRSVDDVLALLPPEVRNSTVAPIRDAIAEALTAILQEHQRRSSLGAALADILRATGKELTGLAADHEIYRQLGETDEALRTRVLGLVDMVTPAAIVNAVNAILAPFTTLRAKYFESELDAWFVHDGTAAWDSFVWVADDQPQASPHYADRMYPDDEAENEGDVVPDREVLGAWSFADEHGRYFVLRLPQLDAVDELGTYAFSDVAVDDGMFVADGSDTAGAESDGSVTSFVYEDQVLADELYAAIVSTVELLKGQGIRWQAYVDPLLS